MPRPDAWSPAEVADLRAVSADTTLTWSEVAAALAAQHPDRPARTTLAVRMASVRYGLPARTHDDGRPVRVSEARPRPRPAQDKAPVPDLHGALDAALAAARAEGRAEVLDALRALLARYTPNEASSL